MEMIDILQKLREYQEAGHDIGDAVENVQRTNPAKVDEGAVKQAMHDDAESMSKEEFLKKYPGGEDFYNSINGVEESKAKPDFLDMDKDGNKKEPMKQAIKDKETKKESVNEAIQISTDSPQEASMMMQILKLAGVQPVDAAMIGAEEPTAEPETEEYANEPDEKTQSVNDLVNVHSGGLNRQKQTFPKVASGDNPMQKTTEELQNSLREQYKSFKEAYETAVVETKKKD
jgi:hypothetical protein